MDLIVPSCNLSSRAHQDVQHHLSYHKHQTESEKTENNLTEHQQSPVLAVRTKRHQQKKSHSSVVQRSASYSSPSSRPLKVDYAGSARLLAVHGRSDQHTDLARVGMTFGVRLEDSEVRKRSHEAKGTCFRVIAQR